MSDPISFDVLIATDGERSLDGLEAALGQEQLTFLRASLRTDWRRIVEALEPFVFVVDLRSRPDDGLAAIRKLGRLSVPVLALADDDATFEAARDAGVVAIGPPLEEADVIAVLLDLAVSEAIIRARRQEAPGLRDDARALRLWEHLRPSRSA